MIDLWFFGLMLIPSCEVALHTLSYNSRLKSCQKELNQVEPESLKISTLNSSTITKPFEITTQSDIWKKIINDAKKERKRIILRQIANYCSIALPIFFVVFLVTFISMGLLLKYNII